MWYRKKKEVGVWHYAIIVGRARPSFLCDAQPDGWTLSHLDCSEAPGAKNVCPECARRLRAVKKRIRENYRNRGNQAEE